MHNLTLQPNHYFTKTLSIQIPPYLFPFLRRLFVAYTVPSWLMLKAVAELAVCCGCVGCTPARHVATAWCGCCTPWELAPLNWWPPPVNWWPPPNWWLWPWRCWWPPTAAAARSVVTLTAMASTTSERLRTVTSDKGLTRGRMTLLTGHGYFKVAW